MTPQKIMNAVCVVFGAPHTVMDSRRRDAAHVLPRQVAMYLCRELLGLSYPHIGRVFVKDHTTVISAVRKIERDLIFNESLARQVGDVRIALGDVVEECEQPTCAGCLRRDQIIAEIRQLLRVMQRAAGADHEKAA